MGYKLHFTYMSESALNTDTQEEDIHAYNNIWLPVAVGLRGSTC